MWWWRELEGVKQEAELLLGHIIWNVADSEYSLLQFDVVDSYGALSKFISVENQVIEITLH